MSMFKQLVSSVFLFWPIANALASWPPGTALLVIDMQRDFVDRVEHSRRTVNQASLKNLLSRQCELVMSADRSFVPVFWIEYSEGEPTFSVLQSRISEGRPLLRYEKWTDDAFDFSSDSHAPLVNGPLALNDKLRSLRIERVVIVGANGDFCVRATAMGAIEAGYEVLLWKAGVIDLEANPYHYPYDPSHWKNEKVWILETIEPWCVTRSVSVGGRQGGTGAVTDSNDVQFQAFQTQWEALRTFYR